MLGRSRVQWETAWLDASRSCYVKSQLTFVCFVLPLLAITEGGAANLSGTGGLYPAQSQGFYQNHNGGGRLPASSTFNQHSALQRISRGGMDLLRLSATADSPSGLASTDLVGPWTRLRRDEKEEADAPQQHWLFR